MPNERMVSFKVNGRTANGFVVEPHAETRAGLIVVHEWWGLNDHIKEVARRFAAEGYRVLAPDLYEGTVTRNAEEAGRLMQSLDQERALETLDGAVSYLQVDAGCSTIGVTGFCMGGSFALLLPCHNNAIEAAAPFYGDVPPDDVLKRMTAPVLFIGASDDPWITTDKMERLKNAMQRFGKEGSVEIYQGVGHAFFNDTRPEAYNREAAEDAWHKVTAFFRRTLKS